MARKSDIERLRARVNRLCRVVSPPQLEINVWQEGVEGEDRKLLYSTALGRCAIHAPASTQAFLSDSDTSM